MSMNPTLEKLVLLHRTETELKHVDAELVEIPKKRKEIEERLGRDRAHLDGAKAALDASQKARKQNAAAVQDLETKRSKYKGQLMEVKTNKEYTAVLHEIEGVERDIKAREDLLIWKRYYLLQEHANARWRHHLALKREKIRCLSARIR